MELTGEGPSIGEPLCIVKGCMEVAESELVVKLSSQLTGASVTVPICDAHAAQAESEEPWSLDLDLVITLTNEGISANGELLERPDNVVPFRTTGQGDD